MSELFFSSMFFMFDLVDIQKKEKEMEKPQFLKEKIFIYIYSQ